MINVFLQDYITRLHAWHKLKEQIRNSDLDVICSTVNNFWQQVPVSSHYLHPADIVDWPTPWELINDNNYCMYARGLGMVYTLMLLGIENIDFVDAIDDNNENVCLVLVNNAKYVLNYYPNQVVNMKLSDFSDIRYLDLTALHKKIGNE